MRPALDSVSLVLPHGTFFGRASIERSVGHVILAEHAADPERSIERHAHEDAHFVLVLGGEYRTSARGADRPDGSPLLVYNPPGTVHQDRFASRGDAYLGRFFTLSVPASFEARDDGRSLRAHHARTLVHPFSAAVASQLVRECRRWGSEAPAVVESLALELLAIADVGDRPEEDGVTTGAASARTAPGWLYRAVDQIEDRCTDEVTVGELARDAGVHPVHVARSFRRWVGCTPGELFRRRRLERALVALRATGAPLSHVAMACGFADQSHLNRAVRASTGLTPRAYRRQQSRACERTVAAVAVR